MVARTPPETPVADLRTFAQAERGRVDPQVYDALPHGGREGALLILTLLLGRAKDHAHPLAVKTVGMPAQGPLLRPGLSSTLRRQIANQYDGAELLIDPLFGPETVLLNLPPIVGVRAAWTCRHGSAGTGDHLIYLPSRATASTTRLLF